MSLYDVIDEIGKREIVKAELGDNQIWGVMLGIVAKNYDDEGKDPKLKGRVCVTIPTRNKNAQTGNASELRWARVAMPSGGEKWGHYFLPEVGDQVLLAFEGGNIERPYVIGCIPREKVKFTEDAFDEKNQIKRIGTRHGSSLTFFDNAENGAENGEKDYIQMETAQKNWLFAMDNEKKKAVLSDKEQKNYIEISAQKDNEKIEIQAQSAITLRVGENITITCNGASGTVTIKANSINLSASEKLEVKGQQVTLEGSQSLSAKGSTTKVEGTNKILIKSMSISMVE